MSTDRREFFQVAAAASGLIAAAMPQAATAAPAPQGGSMGARFRALMNAPDPLLCPETYDMLSTRLVWAHGFSGAFVGSSVVNQALAGLPDQGIATVNELVAFSSVIAQNVDIPILTDVDDFGNTPLNVYRFAKMAERGGIGAAAFDDRMPMNRAAAYNSPGVYSKERMIDNIHAAADARTDMVLIARCLAPTPNNDYTEMLDRAAAYAEAGADCIWIGLRTPQDYVKASAMVSKPLMAVVGGANFPATADAMKAAHVSVGQSASLVTIALGAVDRALAELKNTGHMTEAQKGALSREATNKIELVEELNGRSLKYHLPSGSAAVERP